MLQLIQAATFPQSNEQRAQAEEALIKHRQLNTSDFFGQCSEIFKSSEVPDKIRQAVGTILAVSVVTKIKNGSRIWDLLSENQKTNVKNGVLQVLIDPDRSVRRAAANIVSAICQIELPRNEWDGIVEKICININHDNQIVKESSILTLGFICSRIKENSSYTFPPQLQESIITGIVMGIQQSEPELVETSLKALRQSISSLTQILENQQYREFLLKQVGEVITNGKFAVEGLQILGQFVKSVFQSLTPYLKDFLPLLQPFLSNPQNQEACIAAMEIWENIAAECKEAPPNAPKIFVGDFGIAVVTMLLKNLCVMESEDLEGNDVSESANKALQTIFDLGSLEFKPLVLEFIGSSINNEDWRLRQASIRAFALLLLGLPEGESQNLISNSLEQLIALLQDKSMAVQYSALESFVMISQFCGVIIIKNQNFVECLKIIVSKIYVCEKFLKSVGKIIENLCQADRENRLGKFDNISDDLISALLQLSLNNASTLSMINWAVSAIMSIIEVTENQQVSKKYIVYVLENFDHIAKVDGAEKRQILASAFFTITQYCLHALKNSNVDMQILTAIYEKVVSYFKFRSQVSADGLYSIEALVPYFVGDTRLIDDFWMYIQHALTKKEDPILFRATVICIGVMASFYKEYLGNKLESFVPLMIDLLKSHSFDRELKIDCLMCLGEVCLSAPKSCTKFLPSIVEVVIICCNAAIGMNESDFAYSQQLKDAIIQCLMCIVHGFNTEGPQLKAQLNPFVQDFFRFSLVTLQPKYQATVDYFNRTILLLADLAKYYPDAVAPFKKDQALHSALNTFKNVGKSSQNIYTINYAQQQLK